VYGREDGKNTDLDTNQKVKREWHLTKDDKMDLKEIHTYTIQREKREKREREECVKSCCEFTE